VGSELSVIKMKGISPLIASVILIAVTLAIAGILSTWAFQFVGRTQTGITTRSECSGAFQFVTDPYYSGGNLSLSYFNTRSDLTLENMTLILSFASSAPTQTPLGSLAPQATGYKSFAGLPSKPTNLQIFSANCAEIPLANRPV
jgi:flagellin-like protein